MQVTQQIVVKRLSKTIAGELIRARLGGNIALCLVLDQPEGIAAVPVAILGIAEPPKALPVQVTIPREEYCVSLGTHWLLEPVADSLGYVGDANGKWQPGAINIEEDGRWILNVVAWDSFAPDGFHFDLTASSLTEGPSNFSVPLLSWRIWLSKEHRDREGGEPALRWPAEESGPLVGTQGG